MRKRKTTVIRRIPLETVGIEEPVKIRLVKHINTLEPRPTVASVVTRAVIEYLSRQEGRE
jgi:hypothetical protein